jgi:hypothetical protein
VREIARASLRTFLGHGSPRRAQFQERFERDRRRNGPSSRTTQAAWRAVDPRSHAVVIGALGAVVLLVVVLAVWFSRDPQRADSSPATSSSQAGVPIITTPNSASASTAPTASPGPGPGSGSGSGSLAGQPPIPTGGVNPITPPASVGVVDAATVQLTAPPTSGPTRAELSTPDGAMRAWLARWCPFHYANQFAAAEQQARPAMTDIGWSVFDPRHDGGARQSWNRTVAAREAGRCAQPTARISPEAPRSATETIVIGAVDRVITAHGQPPYVEQLSELRIVRRGADGLWRVDLPTAGG